MEFHVWQKPPIIFYEGYPSGILLESPAGEETEARIVFEGMRVDYKSVLISKETTNMRLPLAKNFPHETVLVQYFPHIR